MVGATGNLSKWNSTIKRRQANSFRVDSRRIMNNDFHSPEAYELFIYTVQQKYRSIRWSTLCFVRRGSTLARIAGDLYFNADYRLAVRQRLVFERLPIVISEYGYEIWKGSDKLCWYDSQPHPGEPALQSTHPHHKHIPPDMKHHRIPAPGMSFDKPNLPSLISEIETLIEKV